MERSTFRCDSADSNGSIVVQRWDAAQPLPKAQRTREGYLRAPATRVARSGVQEYRREDGTIQRELRLDSDVFSSESLESLDGKPVVHKHPGKVTAANARKHARGVAVHPRQDGEFIVADLIIHDEDMIKAAERGDSEISLGYDTVLVPIPGGVFRQDGHPLNGERADYLQTEIVHNHVALIAKGRANEGRKDRPVRLRLDSSNNLVADEDLKGKRMKVTINGVEFDVEDEVAKAIESQNTNHANQIAASKAAKDKAEARADTAEAKLTSLENEKHDVAKQEEKFASDAARFELMSEAKQYLRIDSADLARMSDLELMRKIVIARNPETRLDGKDEGYVRAAYDLTKTNRPNAAAQLAQHITRMEHGKASRSDSANESPLAKKHREIAEKRKGA